MKKFLFLLFIIVAGFSSGDLQKELIKLNWEYNDADISNVKSKLIPTFENAEFKGDLPNLPVYSRVFDLNSPDRNFLFSIENPVFEEVNFPLDNKIVEKLKSDIQPESRIVSSGGDKKCYLEIIPFKKEGNKVFMLKSFELKRIPETVKTLHAVNYEWKSESVLKQGKWLKIATTERGIYKIPYSKLSEWGFSNPENVHVFGAGGTILSEDPGVIEFDDLPQNTVWHGKNNGVDCLFFYATGTDEWTYDSKDKLFKHTLNDYSTKGYYFLTEDEGNTKMVDSYTEVQGAATNSVTSFDSYDYYENELENILPLGSGKRWFGEKFRNNSVKVVSFNVPDNAAGGDLTVRISTVARSYKNSDMTINVDQTQVKDLKFSIVNTADQVSNYAYENTDDFPINISSDKLDLRLKYLADNSTSGVDENAVAWLDYIEINYRRKLKAGTDPVFWRDLNSVGENNIIGIDIENSSEETRLFDITQPSEIKEVPLQLTGNIAYGKRPADELKEYVVFNNNGVFKEPELVGEVKNQNLHAMETPEYLILSYPGFLSSAQQLADFHRNYDNMSVAVVSVNEVYNEFSSGRNDATGIRNFIKMFYDRGQSLKYVLLFGDGSFDNRNIRPGTKNFIPTYQSENSLSPVGSFVTDDYYVILDSGESVTKGAIDLGIGRIPVSTAYEAELVVNKIENYYNTDALGDWRNIVCFIADDQDAADQSGNQPFHTTQSETLAGMVNKNHAEFITDKIYLDSYVQVTTSGSQRYPDVTRDINNRVKDGVLVLNYVGHANERYLADERVLDVSNINSWSNENNLPIFVTATCEFSRYDADETSAGEYVLLNPNGGGIGLFSTTRLVYSGSNFLLSKSFYNFVFETDENGNRYRMGDIIRLAKINTTDDTNKRNFSLLADPALRLSYPRYRVITKQINGKDATLDTDTIGSLQRINIGGIVADYLGNKLTDFSGEIEITVFDKEEIMHTLGNDGGSPIPFKVQQNIIYKGIADVLNGDYSFSFIVPKDISYELGDGKIIYYASNGEEDAHGAFTNFVIGGSSDATISDSKGPEINLYMDDINFVSGGKTGKSTTLLAYLSDENGINTVGTGIGHDITAVLDDDYSNVMVLNNYYKADKNAYTSGKVEFPFQNLSVGKHKLKLKAWDVANNSSEAVIEFEVSGEFAISSVTAYPNPANDYAYFTFEHNQAGATLDIVIEIFDQTGRRVDYISQQVGSNGTKSNPIRWDFNETQIALRSGIYVYRVSAKNNEGLIAFQSGKLTVSR